MFLPRLCGSDFCLFVNGEEVFVMKIGDTWFSCQRYPIISIEDGLDESDWEGWSI